MHARQAIVTKYLGATNHCPARVKASCDAGSKTLCWDHALNMPQNHSRVAQALVEKLDWGWGEGWIPGGMPQRSPFAYAFVDPKSTS